MSVSILTVCDPKLTINVIVCQLDSYPESVNTLW